MIGTVRNGEISALDSLSTFVGIGMDRETLVELFLGSGSNPPSWATNCPVGFDVWLEFAQPSEDGLDQLVDLIFTVHEDHAAAEVLEQLASMDLPYAEPAAIGGFVIASISLPDLVRAVVPLTSLERVLQAAQREGRDGLYARVQRLTESSLFLDLFDHVGEPDLPGSGEDEDPERTRERNEHLDWFLRLLHGVVASCTDEDNDLAGHVVDMVLGARVDRNRRRGDEYHTADWRRRYPVESVAKNRMATPAVTQSRATVKADAAEQVFSIDCGSIGWAVLDSGIDKDHPAFAQWSPGAGRAGSRVVRVFDFTDARSVLAAAGDTDGTGLVDWRTVLPAVEMILDPASPGRGPTAPTLAYRSPHDDHGTHVAGVLGGHWPARRLHGVCRNINLYDFRVLQGNGDEFSILTALQAIRHINERSGRLVIAGANLSLSIPHNTAWGCGWTPVCQEAERLVRSGVVVVAAAGNASPADLIRTTTAGGSRSAGVSDPGNADAVITVGSTHRSNPHRHGVSHFSGRGPTADGRAKPDLVAPGELIDGPVPGGGIMPKDGTSQAAAHVSGAAAMLLARHRELIGRPERIKEILCSTATDLGRERSFQGWGLVDVLRAIQSV